MDNKHNSLNLAAKIYSDICPLTLSVPRSLQFSSSFARKTVRFSEQIMSADKYPSIFSRQMKAIVYLTCLITTIMLCFLFLILCYYYRIVFRIQARASWWEPTGIHFCSRVNHGLPWSKGISLLSILAQTSELPLTWLHYSVLCQQGFTFSTKRMTSRNPVLLLIYGKLRKRVRWTKSCAVICYPSGQDSMILPTRVARFFPTITFCRRPSGCTKVFFCQIFSLKVKIFSVILCRDGTMQLEKTEERDHFWK